MTLDNYIILPERTHGSYSYPELLVSIDRVHDHKNWEQAHEALAKEDSLMLTPRQLADCLLLLRSGNVHDGTGTRLPQNRIDALYKDITEVRFPYRAEWLDARFSKRGTNLNIAYHKIKPDGTLEEVTEPLEECLMSDRLPGIDLDYWLNNATAQGLPPRNTPNGALCYWHPREGAVAGFWSNLGGGDLNCDGGPLGSVAGLGVRRAKTRESIRIESGVA